MHLLQKELLWKLATIRRGCGGEKAPEDSCWERETDDHQYRWKDCQQSCDKNMCNNDLSVGDKIVEDSIKDLSCFQCKWREEVFSAILIIHRKNKFLTLSSKDYCLFDFDFLLNSFQYLLLFRMTAQFKGSKNV